MADLPGPLQALDRGVRAGVTAACAQDEPGLTQAVAGLRSADPVHVQRLLEAVLRPALEARHPDGVDGDDLADLLEDVMASSTWADRADAAPLDALAVAVVLTGAFGIEVAPPEDLPHPVPPAQVARHALLVVAHVLGSGRDLRRGLDLAWRELARADAQD